MDELGVNLVYSHAGSGHRLGVDITSLPPATMDGFLKVVFLHRDPRDTVVSGFHQKAARLDGYAGGMSEFLRDSRYGLEKVCTFNLNWLALAADRKDIQAVSYEDLRRRTPEVVREILAFFGEARATSEITDVVSRTSFDRMRAREAAGEYRSRYGSALAPKNPDDPNSFKVRRGKVGGFREELDPGDIEFAQEVLRRLRYPLTIE